MRRILPTSMLLGIALVGCEDSVTVPPAAPPTSCANYLSSIHWAGALNELQFAGDPTISGRFLYVPWGRELRIVDVSDSQRPAPWGQLDIGSSVRKVLVHGQRADVLTDYSMVVVDVGDPSSPVAMGSVLLLTGAGDFDTRGDGLLYVSTGTGLQIVDARDSMHPRLAGNLTLASARHVAVAGSYAYVSIFGTELSIVDVTDAKRPRVVSKIPLDTLVGSLRVSTNRLYAEGYERILIFDIDNPTSPRLLGETEAQQAIHGFEVQEKRIFVAVSESFENAVEVFDVRPSGRASLAARFRVPGDIAPSGIAAAGEHVFVVDPLAGLQVFGVPAARSLEASVVIDVGDRAQDVAAAGDYLFVAAWMRGLVIVDVSDPERPVIVGHADTPSVAEGIAVAGDLAYVADWDAGLYIADVSNPAAPRIIGSVDTPGYAKHVAVDGGYAYVADNVGGLQVIDATQPAAPRLLTSVNTGTTIDVAVQGGFVYTTGFGAMHVIDVADPASAHSVGNSSVGGWGIAVRGTRVFVVGNAFEIFDVSTPSAPLLLGRMPVPSEARGVDVTGDVAYLVDFGLGVIGVDVSNPVYPTAFGTVGTPRLSHRIVSHDGRLFLANVDHGILVAPAHCP